MADGPQTTWLPPGRPRPSRRRRACPIPAPEPQRGWRRLFGPLIVALRAAGQVRQVRACCSPARRSSSRRPGRCSCRSRPTASSGAGRSRSASCCCCSSTRWGTSSSCAARASRRARRCSSRSSAPSWPRSPSATTPRRRPASGSPGRCSARSVRSRCSPIGESLATSSCERSRSPGSSSTSSTCSRSLPLDGGRAMAAMSPWMWFVGLFAGRRVRLRLPEPDHHPHRPRRRVGDLPPLEDAAGGRRRAALLLPREPADRAARARRVPRAHRGLRARDGPLAHRRGPFSDV